jgi:hypothetical protein
LIEFIRSNLDRLLQADNACTYIDQDAARGDDALRLQADAESRRELDREQCKTSMRIGTWARETVAARRRGPVPRRMRREIMVWLPVLLAPELINPSKVGRDDIRCDVYGGTQTAGVRAVQPLEPSMLVFSEPLQPAEI